mmetsp:Transcript_40549/g.66622  ORF Transcript_40549/g.66622 Transcript_40549/m.66622 type:complete len:439 (-) Transcript_40549:4506-5822(-)
MPFQHSIKQPLSVNLTADVHRSNHLFQRWIKVLAKHLLVNGLSAGSNIRLQEMYKLEHLIPVDALCKMTNLIKQRNRYIPATMQHTFELLKFVAIHFMISTQICQVVQHTLLNIAITEALTKTIKALPRGSLSTVGTSRKYPFQLLLKVLLLFAVPYLEHPLELAVRQRIYLVMQRRQPVHVFSGLRGMHIRGQFHLGLRRINVHRQWRHVGHHSLQELLFRHFGRILLVLRPVHTSAVEHLATKHEKDMNLAHGQPQSIVVLHEIKQKVGTLEARHMLLGVLASLLEQTILFFAIVIVVMYIPNREQTALLFNHLVSHRVIGHSHFTHQKLPKAIKINHLVQFLLGVQLALEFLHIFNQHTKVLVDVAQCLANLTQRHFVLFLVQHLLEHRRRSSRHFSPFVKRLRIVVLSFFATSIARSRHDLAFHGLAKQFLRQL